MSGPSPGQGGPEGASPSTPETHELVVHRLFHLGKTRPNIPALMQRNDSGRFMPITWGEYQELVQSFAAACISVGLPVGGAVGIIGEGRSEWVVAALGAMSAGGMAAGIYQTATAEQTVYILAHCEAMVAVVEDATHWEKLSPHLGELPRLRRIVFMSGEVPEAARQATSPAGGALGQSFREFLASGGAFREVVDKRVAALLPDQVASLIYTSGTTGQPKGVMLTHHNLAWTASALLKVYKIGESEVVASYLPLSHIAEQLLSIYVAVTCGACVYFAGGIDKLRETLTVARPTIFLAVPRVWEKLQAALSQKLGDAKPIQRRVIAWARDVGLRSGRYRLEHGTPFGLLLLEEKVAAKLLFTKLKTALGLERVHLALSGAAAIRKEVLDFFLSLQLPIREVYGLSECAGPMTVSGTQNGQTRLGAVGRVIPGGIVKLAPDGEVLYQGANVFAGYFKEDQATAAALQGGWLHTGDIGEFDADGFLRITDRKKDLFKTSGGRYVAPTPIEGALRTIPLVSQALVVGENRRYIVALLTLDAERGRAFAKEHGLPEELDAFVAHEKVRAHIQEHIEGINRGRERVETVKRFTLLPHDFTVENDEMTPTQKLRRRVILTRYAKDIDAMYEPDDADESKVT
jgi:long-chain acyl-CoA synthetase